MVVYYALQNMVSVHIVQFTKSILLQLVTLFSWYTSIQSSIITDMANYLIINIHILLFSAGGGMSVLGVYKNSSRTWSPGKCRGCQ